MQDYNQAFAHIAALTGQDPNTTLINFRCIHDVNKEIPAHSYDGTLPQIWSTLVDYQARGYGIFININQLDGNGRELSNVASIRAHVIDLDNLSAQQNLERATAWYPAPSFAVQTSPSKYHCYWPVAPYRDNDRYTLIQRKLRQFFDGDKSVIDPTRVLRLAGTSHLKAAPHLVTCWSLPGYGYVTPAETLEAALASVNVIDGGGGRHDLGEPSLAAPSLDWLRFALKLLDPNDLDRGEWISTTAAIKQAGWTLIQQEQELFDIWSEWCARYTGNDQGENLKQWSSIRQTEVGWPSIKRRVPSLVAYQHLMVPPTQPVAANNPMPGETTTTPAAAPPMPAPPELDCSGEMLTHMEQQVWFKDCVFVGNFGKILTPEGRLTNATQFNGSYGGKKFIIDGTGKVTNEAWQAATRSTLWTVPKVDHIRFLPSRQHMEIVSDALGRKGVNTYKPIVVDARPGDPSPFLNHLAAMLPVETDRKILLDFMAHNARFPGYKIPWAPLVQSAEGVGKGAIKRVIKHVMGGPYVHFPNAKEMVESGSKFNAWMRAKLFILVDEIKVDERRDMIEVLKPMISEEEIEIQGKGVDQDKEDNYSNWAFFSNFKDAIPVNKNGRRFATFYSAIQSFDDLIARGMDENYFNQFYYWLDHGGGKEIVAHYLLNYPIERGSIPMRAPVTSSSSAAIRYSRGPIEQMILDAIEDQLPGFRGGWVSAAAVINRLKATGSKSVSIKTIGAILEALQFFEIGRSVRPYFAEDANNRSQLFNVDRAANVAEYGRWQGYEG